MIELNAGLFERALDQLRFRAAAARLHDNKLGVLHRSIICADERERLLCCFLKKGPSA